MSSFEDAQTFLKFIIATRFSKSDTGIPFQSSATQLTTEPAPDDHSYFNSTDKLSPRMHITDRKHRNNPSRTERTVGWQPPESESESIRAALSEVAVPKIKRGGKPITVTNIYLYPIKSCSAFEVCALNYTYFIPNYQTCQPGTTRALDIRKQYVGVRFSVSPISRIEPCLLRHFKGFSIRLKLQDANVSLLSYRSSQENQRIICSFGGKKVGFAKSD